MEYEIIQVFNDLGTLLLKLIPIAVLIIQYAKDKLKIQDSKAEIFSLVTSFILSALALLSYVDKLGYSLTVQQGIGSFLFMVVGTIGPAGGYKLLGDLAGIRSSKE